jgi:hypothetical protein
MKLLLLIPKNLVYVFVCIIFFAFAGMTYITYFETEKNLADFMSYNRTQEVVVVDPLFQRLQEILIIDQFVVQEEDHEELNHQKFNKFYMTVNRACVVKGMASKWGATLKWKDFDYLSEAAGTSTSMVSILTARDVPEGERPDWFS